MRYCLPDSCTGVAHGGGQLTAAPDGTIEADAAAAPELAPHGIAPADKYPPRAGQGAATGRQAVKT